MDDGEFFVITRVCRADLAEVFGDIAYKLTDDEMRRIARRMEDDYIEQLFWGSMKILAEDYINARKEEERCPE